MGRKRFLGIKVGGIANILNPIATIASAVLLTPVMGPVLASSVSCATITATSGGHSDEIFKSAVIGAVGGSVAVGTSACTTVTQKVIFASVSGASIASMTDQNPVKGAIVSGISAGLCPSNPLATAVLIAVIEKDINAGLRVIASHYSQALSEYYVEKITPLMAKSVKIRKSRQYDEAQVTLNDLKEKKQVFKNLLDSNNRQLENNNRTYKDNLRLNNQLTTEILFLPKGFKDPNLVFRNKLLDELSVLMSKMVEVVCTFRLPGETSNLDMMETDNAYIAKIKELTDFDFDCGRIYSKAPEYPAMMERAKQLDHSFNELKIEADLMIDTIHDNLIRYDGIQEEFKKLKIGKVRHELIQIKNRMENRMEQERLIASKPLDYQIYLHPLDFQNPTMKSTIQFSEDKQLSLDSRGQVGLETRTTGVKIGRSDIYPHGVSVAYTHKNNIQTSNNIEVQIPIAFEQSVGTCVATRDTLSGRNEGYTYATHETHLNTDCVIAGGLAIVGGVGAILAPEIAIPVTVMTQVFD